MSNNDEILTEDDAFGDMSNAYQLDATEYDDNDEGTVEYLDLDLEMDSIPESTEEYIPEALASKPKPPVQSSVLKKNYLDEAKSKRKQTQTAAKRNEIAPMLSNVRTKSENVANRNSTSRAAKRKMDSLASETVHAAVTAINAKLADSAQSMNGRGRNIVSHDGVDTKLIFRAPSEDSESSQSAKTDVKTEGDSLDLFFQSMAQTVLNLPSQVQAKIKMDICKVIAMAEIKYCSSDAAPDANKFLSLCEEDI